MKKVSALICIFLTAQVALAQVTNVRKWRQSERDSLDNALLMYEEGLYLMALPVFENILNHHPSEEFIQYSYAKCAIYRSDKHEEAYKYLSAIYNKNKRVEEIDYDLARAAHYSNKLDEALTAVNTYLGKKKIRPENKTKGELLKRYILNAQYYEASPTAAKVSNAGDAINTEGEEYVPAITADESTLIYTYNGSKSTGGLMNDMSMPDPLGVYHEDIYMTRREAGAFKPAAPLTNLNTDANDAAVSLSNDGNTLFIFRDNTDDHGDLYESRLVGDAYSSPVKIPGLVNSYSWDGHCSLSPDGKTLYFSSERGGGYGGKDLYRATLLADSTWGNITNLGDSVNTQYDEDAPFIHPDGVTLYYSSMGRSSMGGYDVFRSIMSPADSSFKKIESLGYPINSTDDDIYFVIGANNKNAYYSSGRPGGKGLKDIYSIEPNFTNVKAAVYLVKGTVKQDANPVAASIHVEMTSKNGATYKTLVSNSTTGAYLVALPAGANYKLSFSLPGQSPQSLNIEAMTLADYSEKVHDVLFTGGAIAANIPAVTNTTAAVDSTAKAAKDTVSASSNTIAVVAKAEKPKEKEKDTFVPQNKNQQKLMDYSQKYGEVKADSLEFRVQIGAFKNADNIVYPNLEDLGKIQKLPTQDGLTRITIGGSFKTLKKAFEFNKKVIAAGQSDAFVIALFNGKRLTLEELESKGIYREVR
jgi:Tol biopolymer transport system component